MQELVLRRERNELVARIQTALTGMYGSIDHNNHVDLVNWGVTIQLVTAELTGTAMIYIRNEGD